MTVIADVEGKLHDAEVLVGLAFEGIEKVQLVYLRIKKMVLRLFHAQYKSRVRHVDVHLLDNQAFGTLSLVLVRAFTVAFVLPSSFTLSLLGISRSYISHDMIYRLGDGFLSASSRCAKDAH